MPVTPHPITVTLNDTDNSTAKAGATVLVRNVTKQTEIEADAVTNSSGIALVDLANLPGSDPQYEVGDEILIIAYFGNLHDAKSYTVIGNSKDQTLNLNHAPFHNGGVRVGNIITGNPTGTVAYCKVWDVDNGELIAHIETPTHDTKNIHFSARGKICRFVLEREAATLIVTTSVNQ